MIPGKTYNVSFKAKSSVTRTISASIHLNNNPWTSSWSRVINLDTAVQTFGVYSFVYNGSISTELRINFFCGTNSNTVWIDDVEIYQANNTTINNNDEPCEQFLDMLTAKPNPFNPSTTIRFSLQRATGARYTIYGAGGRVMREYEIHEGSRSGNIIWDGKDVFGKSVGTGAYIGRLYLGNGKNLTHKLMLLR
jgi:hypothetical protein